MSDDPDDEWDQLLVDDNAQDLFGGDAFIERVKNTSAVVLGQWEDPDADRLRVIVAERYTVALTAAGLDPADPTVSRSVALAIDLMLMHVMMVADFDFENFTPEVNRIWDHAAVLGSEALRLGGE